MLNKLEAMLQNSSSNQLLIMGGDLNTDLPPNGVHVGGSKSTESNQSKPRQPDWQHLRNLVQRHQLSAINTFAKWRPTFAGLEPAGETIATRIDYTFMRVKQMENLCRQCEHHTGLEINAHRQTAQHIPFSSSIRMDAVEESADWSKFHGRRKKKAEHLQ